MNVLWVLIPLFLVGKCLAQDDLQEAINYVFNIATNKPPIAKVSPQNINGRNGGEHNSNTESPLNRVNLPNGRTKLAPRQTPVPIVVKGSGSGVSCGRNKECVLKYLCVNGTLNTSGISLIDFRIDIESPCKNVETCCSMSDKVEQPIVQPGYTSTGCGYRNAEGVSIQVVEPTDNEAQFAEFPWMVSVRHKTTVHHCGGSIITPKVVLTAAHGVYTWEATNFRVLAGEWDTNTENEPYPTQERDVSNMIIHEKFNQHNLINDIALLFLETPFDLTPNVNTICLPPASYDFDDARCFVSGWGKDKFIKGRYPGILKKIEVPTLSHDQCENRLQNTRLSKHFSLHSSFMCAGGELGKDACTDDGGAPLVCPIKNSPDRFYQAGIVAWGIGCGVENIPSVYSKVTEFRGWIDEKLAARKIDPYFFTPVLEQNTPNGGQSDLRSSPGDQQSEDDFIVNNFFLKPNPGTPNGGQPNRNQPSQDDQLNEDEFLLKNFNLNPNNRTPSPGTNILNPRRPTPGQPNEEDFLSKNFNVNPNSRTPSPGTNIPNPRRPSQVGHPNEDEFLLNNFNVNQNSRTPSNGATTPNRPKPNQSPSREQPNEDEFLAKNFNVKPTPNTPFPGADKRFEVVEPVNPGNTTGSGVSCGFGKECVLQYYCSDGDVNTDGSKLINIRGDFDSECQPLETCCAVGDKVEKPLVRDAYKPFACGYRNANGISFGTKKSDNLQAEFAEFPWMVAIMRKEPLGIYVFHRGGSLITPKIVLTGAHCVQNGSAEMYKVRAGEWDCNSQNEPFPYKEQQVAEIVIHQEYNSSNLFNDIALLFLEEPFELVPNINTICLPPAGYSFDLSRCFVTGWGKDSFQKGKYANVLKKIDLPIVAHDKCQMNLRRTRLGRYFRLHSSFLCAGGEYGRDACTGDGGAPLVCPIGNSTTRFYQAGIVAWGIGCGRVNIPGVYANVAALREWIDDEMIYRRISSIHFTP